MHAVLAFYVTHEQTSFTCAKRMKKELIPARHGAFPNARKPRIPAGRRSVILVVVPAMIIAPGVDDVMA